MKISEIKKAPSMPLASPSFPGGPYHFFNREYFIVEYISSPEAIQEAVPEPLLPDGSNTVLYEFIKMPDSTGFGNYTESGIVIPCTHQGEAVNFVAQMYLDCHPPIAGGREIWGFPKKHAQPVLRVIEDTLTGTLRYAKERVALGTMGYKYKNLIPTEDDRLRFQEKMAKTQVNLKMIPCATGNPEILQLISYNLCNIVVQQAWEGPARLHLIPHVQAPVADLPVISVVKGQHFVADLTLPYGKVMVDYLKEY